MCHNFLRQILNEISMEISLPRHLARRGSYHWSEIGVSGALETAGPAGRDL